MRSLHAVGVEERDAVPVGVLDDEAARAVRLGAQRLCERGPGSLELLTPDARAALQGIRARYRILIIDDDEKLVSLMREYLQPHGYELKAAHDGDAGVAAVLAGGPALVILGIRDQEQFPLIFYRENCADMALCEDDIDEGFISEAKAVVVPTWPAGPDADLKTSIGTLLAAIFVTLRPPSRPGRAPQRPRRCRRARSPNLRRPTSLRPVVR